MVSRASVACGLCVVFMGCAQKHRAAESYQKNLDNQIGQRMTFVGKALDRKDKPYVLTAHGVIFIDLAADTWPSEINGHEVRVTGTLGKYRNPVFIPQPGELPQQGIPMPPGTDLEQAGNAYLLRDATWSRVK